MAVPQRMGEAPPTTAAQAAKKKSVNMTKVTKAEEAIFTLQPGKDAIVRLAAALHPFRGVLHFVEDGLSWRSTNKAMTLQALYCLAVVHPEYLVPVALCVLGTCTLTNKREPEESDDDDAPKDAPGDARASLRSRAKKFDARALQLVLESFATWLERVVAVTTWEDPVVTGAFVASCVALAALCCYVRFQTVLLCLGMWAMRPPGWRVVPGPATNLLERMPDKSEEYGRLMQGGGGGKAAAGA